MHGVSLLRGRDGHSLQSTTGEFPAAPIGYDSRRRTAMTRVFSAALAALLSALAVAAIEARTDCNRACLTGVVDSYLKALTANTPAAVPLAPSAKVTFNGRAVPLAQAFWDGAERTIYRFDIV